MTAEMSLHEIKALVNLRSFSGETRVKCNVAITQLLAKVAEVEALRKALAIYACGCIGHLPDCVQGEVAGCGWTARAALCTKP